MKIVTLCLSGIGIGYLVYVAVVHIANYHYNSQICKGLVEPFVKALVDDDIPVEQVLAQYFVAPEKYEELKWPGGKPDIYSHPVHVYRKGRDYIEDISFFTQLKNVRSATDQAKGFHISECELFFRRLEMTLVWSGIYESPLKRLLWPRYCLQTRLYYDWQGVDVNPYLVRIRLMLRSTGTTWVHVPFLRAVLLEGEWRFLPEGSFVVGGVPSQEVPPGAARELSDEEKPNTEKTKSE